MNKNLPHIFIIFLNTNEGTKERVHFKTHISDDLLVESDVIIDILNGKIVKSRLDIKDEDKFVEKYMTKYSDQITEITRIFFSKNKDIWEKLKTDIEKIISSVD